MPIRESSAIHFARIPPSVEPNDMVSKDAGQIREGLVGNAVLGRPQFYSVSFIENSGDDLADHRRHTILFVEHFGDALAVRGEKGVFEIRSLDLLSWHVWKFLAQPRHDLPVHHRAELPLVAHKDNSAPDLERNGELTVRATSGLVDDHPVEGTCVEPDL